MDRPTFEEITKELAGWHPIDFGETKKSRETRRPSVSGMEVAKPKGLRRGSSAAEVVSKSSLASSSSKGPSSPDLDGGKQSLIDKASLKLRSVVDRG
jgi:hypothetical protein